MLYASGGGVAERFSSTLFKREDVKIGPWNVMTGGPMTFFSPYYLVVLPFVIEKVEISGHPSRIEREAIAFLSRRYLPRISMSV